MALNTQLSNAVVNGQANDLAARLNGGYLRIYSGAQPANADTAIGTQTLLAELRFSATAFGAPVDGLLTANAITSDSSANATGTASWFRALASDGVTVVMDGSIGTADANMIMADTSITAGQTVSCSEFKHDVKNGA